VQALVDAISPHIAPCLLVIFRFGGLMVYGPVFGSSVVPVRVRVFLSFILGIATYPVISQTVAGGATLDLALWTLAPLVAMEVTFGLIIGFVASLPLIAAQTGGLVMGQQMGLGFARFYNPGIDDEADVVGQVLFLMTLAAFVMVGGHEQMVHAVLRSFEHLPLGGFSPDVGLLSLLSGLLLSAFEIALRVAAPLLALIFLETVAMGFVAKTVPQLNILSLGFPVRILAGLFIIMIGLVAIDQVLMEAIEHMLGATFTWIESLDINR